MKKTVGAALGAAVLLIACGLPQPDSCKKYVACAQALHQDNAVMGDYGPNGTCWRSTQTGANACEAFCTSQTATLASQNPDAGACQ